MATTNSFITRIRAALSQLPHVQEKKMFRGIAFMVNDKLCVCESDGELMIRFDPALTDEVLQKPGVRPMVMRGKQLAGYAYVAAEALKSKKAFDNWVALALAFNDKAKSSRKKQTSAKR